MLSQTNKRLLIGLGNPGRKFLYTPHNVGYEVANIVAHKLQLDWKSSRKFHAEVAEGITAHGPIGLLKPTTFMNLSGESVSAYLRNSSVALEHILIITDDINLPMGKLRIRSHGSSGGHKGLRSIIDHLNSSQFPRLRLGIHTPNITSDLESYVLTPFWGEERVWMHEVIKIAADVVISWIDKDVTRTGNKFNGLLIPPP